MPLLIPKDKMKKADKVPIDQSTEEKIKRAAEKVFLEKGYSASRTRDIAEEAGINLALLNYYFRSKENLYIIIMMEKLEVFFDVIIKTLTDNTIPFEQKLTVLVNKYTDLLIHEPNLPLFLLSETHKNPDFFASKLNIKARLREAINIQPVLDGKNQEEGLQLLLSFLGLTLFPFVIRPAFSGLFDLSEEQFERIIEKRREFVPKLMVELFDKMQK